MKVSIQNQSMKQQNHAEDSLKMDYHKVNVKIMMLQLSNMRNQEEKNFLEVTVLSKLKNAL